MCHSSVHLRYIGCDFEIKTAAITIEIVLRKALNMRMQLQACAACVSIISGVCGSCCKHMDVLASLAEHGYSSRALCDCPAGSPVDSMHGAWDAGMDFKGFHN